MIRKILLAVMLAAGVSSSAFAQTSFTAKDAAGATQTFKSFNCNTSNICSLSVPADSTGAAFGVTGNPFFMAFGTGVTLPAYAAIPAFKIDQTTPGTTNGVQVLSTAAVSVAPGQIADGGDTTQGAKADAACAGGGTACSVNARLADIESTLKGAVPLTTSGGWTPKLLNALSTTVTSIKNSSAGLLGLLQCGNTNASQGYIQVFDAATTGAVTLGTTTPKLSIPIAATNSGGFALPVNGFQFSNGIQVAATTTATGLTALGTAVDCNAGFN